MINRQETPSAEATFDRDSMRLPPLKPFVSLSHAVSWIAFGYSMKNGALNYLLLKSDFEEAVYAKIKLNEAVANLVDLGSTGKIILRGRYIAHVGVSNKTALTTPIPQEAFHDFRQFDILYDGLRRGFCVNEHRTSGGLDTPILDSSGAAYHFIVVQRDALLEHFSQAAEAVVRVARMTPFKDREVIEWCRAWIEHGNGNGMDSAWRAFKVLPKAKGLSRDDVFRPAWKKAKTAKS